MTSVTLPTVDKSRAGIRLIRNDNPLEAFSGAEVIVEDVANHWSLSFTPLPQTTAESRAWKAALVQLSRLSNTFDMTPPDHDGNPAGYAGSAPVVKGAGQLGLSVDADGVTPSTAIAKAGAYIGVGGELKMLTADADSDVGGNVTFNFEPPFRESPADNSTIELDAPVATFRLVRPIAEWELEIPEIYRLQIDAVETY